MSKSGDSIFPLLDRQTPVMDRIRDRRGSNNADEGAMHDFGRAVGQLIKIDDEEERAELSEKGTMQFMDGLTEELDISQEQMAPDIPEAVYGMLNTVQMKDVLPADELAEDTTLSEYSQADDEEEDGEEDADALGDTRPSAEPRDAGLVFDTEDMDPEE